MILRTTFIFILLLLSVSSAQEMQQRRGGTITGTVIESGSKHPIEYANIILFRAADSTQVTGTISDNEGKFTLTPVPPGAYYVNIQFLGFNRVTKEKVVINRNNFNPDLGIIELVPAALNLDNVVVEGQKNPITYQIDRKVIDVSQIPVAISGTAADVLEHVPSVTVDINGNVSLRGSQSFTVLIDGRPSVLDAQDILQQIPAGTIENIEIITNPSAKYDPEGSAGIINILLKKTRKAGFGGITSLNAGLNNKYGGDALFEYKLNGLAANFGLDYNNRFHPGTNKEERRTIFNDVTSVTIRNGETERGRKMFGLKGGFDYNFSENDILGFSGRFGDRSMRMNSFQNRYQSIEGINNTDVFRNISKSSRGGSFYVLNLNYTRKFSGPGHQVITEFSYRKNNSDEESLTELFSEGIFSSGRRSEEYGPSRDLEAKLDYTLPFSQTSRFEAGYQGEVELSTENTGYYQADSIREYIFRPQFSHTTDYNEAEHALYSTYSGETGDFGYQLGLRAEYTFRDIKVDDFGSFIVDEFDFFPGVHASYKFAEGKQLMGSYTRRINRPHGWALEPFETWSDANNVRRGNPALLPEYIDSYEMGVSTFFGTLSASLEGYYRINNNKIEQLTSAYAQGVTLSTFGNVGKDYSLGSEMMLNFGIADFWDVRLMGNVYDYRIKGEIFNQPFSRSSFNWNTRFNNNLKFSTDTQLQLTFSYNSPSVSAQGTREGYLTTDIALRQDLFNRSLSLTLQVRDLFSTAKHEQTSSGIDFYNYSYFNMESPMVMLNIRFNINNFRNNEERRGQSQRDMDEGEGF
jgi:outer membrane receptor protein involved in Fe transport